MKPIFLRRLYVDGLWLICLVNCIEGVRIYDRADRNNDSKDIKLVSRQLSNRPTIENSKAKIGLVYNDADDVIHIIEPPQHFEDLKRRHRQKNQHQVKLFETKSTRELPKRHHQAFQVATTKVKDQKPQNAKVEKPVAIERNNKQQIIRTKPVIPPIKQVSVSHDFLTQETRVHAENQLPMFPMEILASVRKTEQEKHQKQSQKRPFAKQRVRMQKINTVIMEKGYEQSRYKQGQETRSGGLRTKRMRRELLVPDANNIDFNRARKVTSINIEQGSQLLARLDALIKHAARFVPDDNDTVTHNSVLDNLRRSFQNDFEPKQLIGEIEPTTTIRPISPKRELYEILESSLNATDMIMQELIQKEKHKGTAIVSTEKNCEYTSSDHTGTSSPNDNAFKQLQSKIDCMRTKLSAVREKSAPISTITTTTTATATSKSIKSSMTNTELPRGNKRFGQRTKYRTTKLPKALHQSTSNHFKLGDRSKTQTEKSISASVRSDNFPTQILRNAYSPRNISTAAAVLLYNDVMANIRNTFQKKKLQDITNAKPVDDHVNEETAFSIDFFDASNSPSTSNMNASEDASYFHDLSRYLNDLQQIVMGLPSTNREYNIASNTRSGTSISTSSSDWYLINKQGKLSETPFDIQLRPSAVIFHRFPDGMKASIFLRNHTILAATPSDVTMQQENGYDIF